MGNRKWQVILSLVNLLNLATILEKLFEAFAQHTLWEATRRVFALIFFVLPSLVV